MKLICDRNALAEGLAAASSVTLARTPKPILQCVKLTAEKGSLTLTAYDQEVGLRYRIKQVDVTKPGETLVMGERLSAIVRESKDETMALESTEDMLHVRGSDSHFQIVGQSVREFPQVPDMDGEPDFTVLSGALRSAVERTIFATARENTRYAINGVLWERKAKQLQLVATDGRRMALSAASLEKSKGDDKQAIIPSKALTLLGKLKIDSDEPVDVQITSNQVIMRMPEVTISSVLVEGHFPKYQDVIPRDADKKITLPTAEFLSAVRRAALLANLESKGVRMKLTKEAIIFSSRTPEQGEATVRLPCEYGGAEMEIGFNPEFIVDALKVCDDSVIFEVREPSKPGVIRSGANFQYVVMPVNLS